jgi:hypothetical protein
MPMDYQTLTPLMHCRVIPNPLSTLMFLNFPIFLLFVPLLLFFPTAPFVAWMTVHGIMIWIMTFIDHYNWVTNIPQSIERWLLYRRIAAQMRGAGYEWPPLGDMNLHDRFISQYRGNIAAADQYIQIVQDEFRHFSRLPGAFYVPLGKLQKMMNSSTKVPDFMLTPDQPVVQDPPHTPDFDTPGGTRLTSRRPPEISTVSWFEANWSLQEEHFPSAATSSRGSYFNLGHTGSASSVPTSPFTLQGNYSEASLPQTRSSSFSSPSNPRDASSMSSVSNSWAQEGPSKHRDRERGQEGLPKVESADTGDRTKTGEEDISSDNDSSSLAPASSSSDA